jgi:organic hydroperoxide reductase OsmC/OhrA
MEFFRNSLYKIGQEPAKTSMSGIGEQEVGPPTVYGGSAHTLNPEEMFVASVNTCLMLVFFHFVKKFSVEIHSYHSEAVGQVEKTNNGLRFKKVEVDAKVSLGNDSSAEKIKEITELAERYCLVSGSLACPVEYKVEVVE